MAVTDDMDTPFDAAETPESAIPAARPAAPRAWPAARVRLASAAILVACAAVLSLAAYLKPNPRGFGTHQQLGLARCGFLAYTGMPCPSCGMTTAFAYTVRGQLIRAAHAQVGGLALALGAAAAGVIAAISLALGRVPEPIRRRVVPYYLFWAIIAAILGGWTIRMAYGLATGELPARFV